MELTKSNEDYLEAIRLLVLKNGVAQVKDIANMLNVKMPSVNSAVRHLAELGLVEYVQYAPVRLTEKGELRADQIIERHLTLKSFLEGALQIGHERSDEIACLMEHILNDEEVLKLKALTRDLLDRRKE